MRNKILFVFLAFGIFVPLTSPAGAVISVAPILDTLPLGTLSTQSSDITEYCRPELSYVEVCAAFDFIELVITGDPLPQLLYRTRIRVPFDDGTPTDGPRIDLLPLGFISTSQGPIPTGTDPATYWVRAIQNLSDESHVLTYCTNDLLEAICGTNSARWTYNLVPGEILILPHPGSGQNRNADAFPEPPTKVDNSFYLTSRDAPFLRGLVHMKYRH